MFISKSNCNGVLCGPNYRRLEQLSAITDALQRCRYFYAFPLEQSFSALPWLPFLFKALCADAARQLHSSRAPHTQIASWLHPFGGLQFGGCWLRQGKLTDWLSNKISWFTALPLLTNLSSILFYFFSCQWCRNNNQEQFRQKLKTVQHILNLSLSSCHWMNIFLHGYVICCPILKLQSSVN